MAVSDFTLELPASIDAERSILGAILLDAYSGVEAAASLRPEHFRLDSHRRTFAAMIELQATGKPIDLVALAETLSRAKSLEHVGGVAYLSSLTDGVARRPSIDQHIRLVLEKYRLRQLIHACNSTIATAMEQADPAEDCIAHLDRELLAIQADGNEAAITLEDATRQMLQEMSRQREVPIDKVLGFRTGMHQVDRATTGIRKGEVWVVGMQTGGGKTALGMQIARENGDDGHTPAVFSLEMAAYELAMRIHTGWAEIPADRMRDARLLSDEEWRALPGFALDKAASTKILINDASALGLARMMHAAKLYRRKHGCELFIVDYLQLIDDPEERELRLRMNHIMEAWRRFAKAEKAAVVMLSQFNRKDQTSKPTLDRLRESGAIGDGAHVVLLPWRTAEGDWIVMPKQRHGRPCDIPVRFNGQRQAWEDDYTRKLQ